MDQTGQGLVATGLAKTFGKRQVVHDVSLSLQRGEVVGLLGPNGAGKTTCFYMIMGLIGADDGSIRIDGADVTALPMYQRARLGLGYLPQEASIFRGMSVEENIMAVVELVESPQPVNKNAALRQSFNWLVCASAAAEKKCPRLSQPCRSPSGPASFM